MMLALASLIATASAAVSAPVPGYRLLKVSETEEFWAPQSVAEALPLSRMPFMDITDHQDVTLAPLSNSTIPAGPTHQDVVRPLIDQLDKVRMETFLTRLIEFNNRYYTSPTGIEAAEWIYQHLLDVVAESRRNDITVSPFHHDFPQISVIVRIEGSVSREAVVIGGHIDSTGIGMPNGRAPGADDDGTGTMTTLEVLQVILDAGFVPENALEFHFFAAEEVGLRGSQDIAEFYASREVPIRAMTNFDMTGYNGKESNVAFVSDASDEELNEFNRKLVDEYLNIPWVNTACGYGCSDHASFNRNGYRSSFPFEATFRNINPNIHTPNDDLRWIDFDYCREFAALGVANMIELSFVN